MFNYNQNITNTTNPYNNAFDTKIIGSNSNPKLYSIAGPMPPSEPPEMGGMSRPQANLPPIAQNATAALTQPVAPQARSMPPPPIQNTAAPAPQATLPPGAGTSMEEIEEIVETIIDERWSEVTENIKKVIDWKNNMEQKFLKMEQRIDDMKSNFDQLYKAVIGKIGEYDKNILKVGADMKAMEKVFSQVLPVFTENVNDLTRISTEMKNTLGKKPTYPIRSSTPTSTRRY